MHSNDITMNTSWLQLCPLRQFQPKALKPWILIEITDETYHYFGWNTVDATVQTQEQCVNLYRAENYPKGTFMNSK